MLESISYYMIFGKPFVLYVGILALLCILATGAVILLNRIGHSVSMRWHFRFGYAAIAFSVIHGILLLLRYVD